MQPMKTRFVLMEVSHAGNVGAAARAMKTMGFDDLVLVRPRWAGVLHSAEAVQRASGADDVLARARVVQDLAQALEGMEHACATVMTARDFGPPTCAPRAHFAGLAQQQQGGGGPRSVALVFGSERFGMANADVWRCHAALQIATNPAFGSLNLAAAVQVLAHEWRMALGGFAGAPVPAPGGQGEARADGAQVAGLLAHWRQALEHVGFLDAKAPKKLLPRLQRLANRAQCSAQEVDILRGIARAMLRCTPPPNPKGANRHDP